MTRDDIVRAIKKILKENAPVDLDDFKFLLWNEILKGATPEYQVSTVARLAERIGRLRESWRTHYNNNMSLPELRFITEVLISPIPIHTQYMSEGLRTEIWGKANNIIGIRPDIEITGA